MQLKEFGRSLLACGCVIGAQRLLEHRAAALPQRHSHEGLNIPSIWRSARSQAAAKVDALASNGMAEIKIPAFLRKQAL